MSRRLSGKTALVTGAASGFGAAIAMIYARERARVAVVDIDQDGADRVTAAIGDAAIAVRCDVTRRDQVDTAVTAAIDAFGDLEIIVNNAGASHPNRPLMEVDEAAFDWVYAVNVKGIFHMTQAVTPHLRARGGGVMLNITSTAGLRPRPGLTWYNGSKGAANTLTKSLAVELREALKRGMADLFGFSINARARVRTHRRGGRTVREAMAFDKVDSVDLIVEPGAGGELIGLLEAKKDTIMDRQQIIDLLNARAGSDLSEAEDASLRSVNPSLLKTLLTDRDATQISDEALLEILTQAVGAREAAPEPGADQTPTAPAPTAQGAGGATGGETGAAQTPAAPNATGAPGAAPAEAAAVAEAVKRVEARAEMRAQVQASPLPAAAKTRVITGLEAAGELTSATVTEAIRAEAAYLGQFAPSGAVRGLGADLARGGSAATLVESRGEKVAAMLEAFFDPQHKDHRHARSFRACYAAITGDERITGRLDACDRGLMTEALDSDSFSNVLGESITRRMVADYRAGSSYDVWRQLASVVPIQDFRT